ncbi:MULTISPECIES: alkene reductase [Kocuria]|uniref:Alkene reductase n=1 Tax=Kocuria oceani TaxID=988827 RepID=A0ABV9TLT0_9MICC|nr:MULTISPECIES: alkene reductase [Kocuria]KLU10812.1 1,2-oxophytodienoate reductase [Kocuria sp. SM24M-10]OLT09107.1 alkene reductase [Kocuria sp. CNJ-770]
MKGFPVPKSSLTTPLDLGSLRLPNRLVMAPLTRMRSGRDGVPGELNVEHYTQRASMGLIVTEGTYPDVVGQGFAFQPGIQTPEQVEGWRRVADSVHDADGRIFMQVMHAGRVSHPDLNGGAQPVAPSAVAIEGEIRTYRGKSALPVPHALTTEELPGVVDSFVRAARNAVEAGLDGVELHGANGYLLHEFLAPGANQRTDEYGGTPENRARFVLEVVRAVVDEIGAERVGLRISPEHNIQDAWELEHEDVVATYTALATGLADLGLAYLSVLHREPEGELVQGLRRAFGGVFLANSGFGTPTSREEGVRLLEEDVADGVVVGRPAIANPDLVRRWAEGLAENEPNPRTFYSQGAEGYTDYPFAEA